MVEHLTRNEKVVSSILTTSSMEKDHREKPKLFPVIFYIILGLLPISAEIRMTMTLTSAMPVMSSVVMMANAYGTDGDYAMGGILVTTVCSIVTLPLVYWILQFI